MHFLSFVPVGLDQAAIVDKNLRFRRVAQVGEGLHRSIYKVIVCGARKGSQLLQVSGRPSRALQQPELEDVSQPRLRFWASDS
jgi:hypothetical protein